MANRSDLRLSVVMPAYNASSQLCSSLSALRKGERQPDELIVVDDGSTDDTSQLAAEFGATVLNTGGRRGPGYGRNLGAKHASGDILFFLDADVCVHPDTLTKVAEPFRRDAELQALIGSYDDNPACPRFLSLYRNLMHHYVHQSSAHEATTFWSGCGAVRRPAFLAMGGFDASYGRPAIEDIEFGYRLHAAKLRIALCPEIQVQHLKSWGVASMVRTDILDRGIPWTMLILRAGRMPNDLNLKLSQRLSVAIVGLCILLAAVATIAHGGHFLRPLAGILLLVMGSFWVTEIAGRGGPLITGALEISLASFVVLSIADGHYHQLILVLVGYAFLFLRELLTRGRMARKRVLGLIYGVYLAGAVSYILMHMPNTPVVFSLALLLVVVVALNLRFYAFLFARLGSLWGLATIPFHLLYHAYNGVSFVVGAIQYHWNRIRARSA